MWWWSEFKKRLIRAFNAYVKREGRIVHSDSMKIRMLIDKIKADFLTPTWTPMTMTYEQALALFRNMLVNQKHPPQMGAAQNRIRDNINEINTAGRGGRGRERGGCGRGGRGSGRGAGRGGRVKPKDKETLRRERAAYNETRRNRAEIHELRLQQIADQSGTTTQVPPPDSVSVSQRSQVSQITSGQSVMGGRNEQAQQRQNRRIAAVTTQRHVRLSTPVIRPVEPPANTAANNECDSNADTCCLGKNLIILQLTFRTADVFAYDSSIGAPVENVPHVSGATAYNDPISKDTFILVFKEALYYGSKMDHFLINPNQVRAYGIPFWDNPYDPARDLTIEVHDSLHIPLQPVGTKTQCRTRVPTTQELITCEHIQMTSPHLWNPADIVMIQGMAQHGGSTVPWAKQLLSSPHYEYLDAASDDALLHSIDPSLVHLGQLLSAH